MATAEKHKPDQYNIAATRAGKRRSWLPSSPAKLAALVLMIPWALIAIPAFTPGPQQGMQLRIFGCPFIHCWNIEVLDGASFNVDRFARSLQNPETRDGLKPWHSIGFFQSVETIGYPLWSKPDHWRYWGSTTAHIQWNWGPLLANAAIGLGIFLVMLVILEWRIRKRGGLFRFRLVDAVVIAVILAIPLATLGNTLSGSARDARLLAQLREMGATQTGTTTKSYVPVWLDRLLDNRIRTLVRQFDSQRSLERVTSINLSAMEWTHPVDDAAFWRIAQIINSFDRLEKVSTSFTGAWVSHLLEHLNPQLVQELHVEIGSGDLSETDVAGLANCTDVEKLSIGPMISRMTGYQPRVSATQKITFLRAIKPMTKLSELEMHGEDIDEEECPLLLELQSLKILSCLSITPTARKILLNGNPCLKIVCNPR